MAPRHDEAAERHFIAGAIGWPLRMSSFDALVGTDRASCTCSTKVWVSDARNRLSHATARCAIDFEQERRKI